MSPSEMLKAVFVVGPILALISLGFALTLRSGVVSLASGKGLRQLGENLSHAVLLIVLCLLALLVLQKIAGFHPALLPSVG